MLVLGAAKFKATCLQVLDRVLRTGEEVTITKRGKAVARVVPSASVALHPQLELRGTAEIAGDIVAPAVRLAAWDALGSGKPRRKAQRPRRKKA
jgi:prevent-host-death family protein